MESAALAAMIDHTLLAPTATPAEVQALVAESRTLGAASACVSPRWVLAAVAAADVSGLAAVPVCSVVGFPSGAHTPMIKGAEAGEAVAAGATEIDMVVALGDVVAADWQSVRTDIATVRAATGSTLLKVIIESAALTDRQIDEVCRVAVDAGADFVKTSTGFHPAGGASVEAVARMRAAVGPDIGVKASGGIRDRATALAMIDAGASRIGASATAAIIGG